MPLREPGVRLPDDQDPANLIVGTLRVPVWVGRVPRATWIFLALAALDAASRITRGLQVADLPPTTIAIELLGIVSGVALVLLPAAVLRGGRAPGRLDPALLQGAIALAAAELVGQLGPGVARAAIGLQNDDPNSNILQSLAIQVPFLLLTGFGLLRLGLALVPPGGPRRPFRRAILTFGATTVALTLVANRGVFDGIGAGSGSELLVPYNLLITAANIAIIGLWTWLASIAVRRDDRPWQLIAMGSLAIVLADAIRPLGYLIGSAQAFAYDVDTILTLVALAAGAVLAVGSVALAAGFASGLEPMTEATSESLAGGLGPVPR